MSKSFSFAGLIPEPLTFKDEGLPDSDRQVYNVQVRELLSTEALVQFMRIEKQVRDLHLDQGLGEDDPARIDTLTDQMLAILIPTLPAERRKAIPLQLRMKFLEWWRMEQGDTVEGSAPKAS